MLGICLGTYDFLLCFVHMRRRICGVSVVDLVTDFVVFVLARQDKCVQMSN